MSLVVLATNYVYIYMLDKLWPMLTDDNQNTSKLNKYQVGLYQLVISPLIGVITPVTHLEGHL